MHPPAGSSTTSVAQAPPTAPTAYADAIEKRELSNQASAKRCWVDDQLSSTVARHVRELDHSQRAQSSRAPPADAEGAGTSTSETRRKSEDQHETAIKVRHAHELGEAKDALANASHSAAGARERAVAAEERAEQDDEEA